MGETEKINIEQDIQDVEALIPQITAEKYISAKKYSLKTDIFYWEPNSSCTEEFTSPELSNVVFLIDISRNEIKLKAQLRDAELKSVILMRVDCAKYHTNPDGTLISGPHLHKYREGYGVKWAEKAEWIDVNNPLKTLDIFLKIINASFRSGFNLTLL